MCATARQRVAEKRRLRSPTNLGPLEVVMHAKVPLLILGLVIVALLAIMLIVFALICLVACIGPASAAIAAIVFGCIALVSTIVGLVGACVARRGTE